MIHYSTGRCVVGWRCSATPRRSPAMSIRLKTRVVVDRTDRSVRQPRIPFRVGCPADPGGRSITHCRGSFIGVMDRLG